MSYEHIPTICIDLDGTLAAYDGWRGPEHFGAPLPGALAALAALRARGWRIIIFTTRGDREKVRAYLEREALLFDYINENPDQPAGSNPGKPFAHVYVDDRAISFRGDWSATLDAVFCFKTWSSQTD